MNFQHKMKRTRRDSGKHGNRGSRFGPILLAVSVGLLVAAPDGPAYAELAALVLEPDSGAIPYAYRAGALHQPASLTKMMTLYMAFEALRSGHLKPDQKLRVSRTAARQRPSRLGLRPGRTIAVEDAILALITKSANDASVVIAETIAGSEAAFARRMTERAHALGMNNTEFRNASGLYHPDQQTSARDMARLAVALMRDFPERYRLFATKSFVWHGRRYRNHNPMLSSYVGADGIKTGYVRQSGYNLVVSAERDGRRLIAVVLGSRSIPRRDWTMTTILDYGFQEAGNDNPSGDVQPLRYAAAPSGANAFDASLRAIQPQRRERARVDRANSEPATGGSASRDTGKWAIQVGAYRSAPPAREAATAAADRIPGMLAKAKVSVVQIVRNGRPMYRARLTGLSEAEARKSCRQLALHRIPCLAVADTGEFRKVSMVR